MKRIDMHTHSFFSDGLYAPKYLIRQAIENGLAGLSVTDHDNIGAILPAFDFIEDQGIQDSFFFLPGVEFSTVDETLGEVHILGYFPNKTYLNLGILMKDLKRKRRIRLEKIIDCVRKHGYDLSSDDFPEDECKSWGRMHVARALVKKGYFEKTQDTFNSLLKKGQVCYLPREDTSTTDMISKILIYEGFPVVAHPAFLYQRNHWHVLQDMIESGLKGIEVDHPMISPSLKKVILRDTASFGLLYTGGSDFHGDLDRGKVGSYSCPLEDILEFIDKF